jgi:glyoxylase-like metal-dependent hydrolase (beta-lactamase superfamily II)
MRQMRIGDITIDAVIEREGPWRRPQDFFPAYDEATFKGHLPMMEPEVFDSALGMMVITYQTFVLRTPRYTILVDTCTGEDKGHPPPFDFPGKRRWRDELFGLGIGYEQVDYVFCTHLHIDHTGWNTTLRDGRWVPTFPKAKYVFAQEEWENWEELHAREPQPQLIDSVLPVMAAGQAQLVRSDFALDDEVWLEPTPGHTHGHVSIRLASAGAQAIITGDCIHSPVQCMAPEWVMRADVDPVLARSTRRSFLERYCDSSVKVCATHFPEPSIGRITQRGNAFWFEDDAAP